MRDNKNNEGDDILVINPLNINPSFKRCLWLDITCVLQRVSSPFDTQKMIRSHFHEVRQSNVPDLDQCCQPT